MVAETAKTVGNALRLLACFTREEPEMSGAALARRLGLPRTSVLRLLASLEAAKLIERDRRGTWRVGVGAVALGGLYLASNPLPVLTARVLEELARRTECTAYLGVLEGDDAVIVLCREGSLPIRFVFQAGSRLPATTTALGKAILAHLAPEELAARYRERPFTRLTANSLARYEDLVADLKAARERGWAIAREESHAGLTAVGAAILDPGGRPIAGLSLSYLDHPPDAERLARRAAAVKEAAGDLAARLSAYGDYGVPRYHATGEPGTLERGGSVRGKGR